MEVPAEGGQIRCPYCSVITTLEPRTIKIKTLCEPRSPDDPDEGRRIRKLWKKLHHYDSENDIYSLDNEPNGFEDIDGLDHSRRTKKRLFAELQPHLKKPGNGRMKKERHRVYWLVAKLGNIYSLQREFQKKQALLESALELITDDRFLQLIFHELAELALIHENEEAAETWLALCDQAPQELRIDSSLRIRLARLYHRRRDWEMVLRLVGRNFYEIPIEPGTRTLLSCVRAGVLEMIGLPVLAEMELMTAHHTTTDHNIEANDVTIWDFREIMTLCEKYSYQFMAARILADDSGHNFVEGCPPVWRRLEKRGLLPQLEASADSFHKSRG